MTINTEIKTEIFRQVSKLQRICSVYYEGENIYIIKPIDTTLNKIYIANRIHYIEIGFLIQGSKYTSLLLRFEDIQKHKTIYKLVIKHMSASENVFVCAIDGSDASFKQTTTTILSEMYPFAELKTAPEYTKRLGGYIKSQCRDDRYKPSNYLDSLRNSLLYSIDRASNNNFKKQCVIYDRYMYASVITQSNHLDDDEFLEFILDCCNIEHNILGVTAMSIMNVLVSTPEFIEEKLKEREETDMFETLNYQTEVIKNINRLQKFITFNRVEVMNSDGTPKSSDEIISRIILPWKEK